MIQYNHKEKHLHVILAFPMFVFYSWAISRESDIYHGELSIIINWLIL